MIQNIKLALFTLIDITFWILISPILIINNIRWKSGICRKCNRGRYILDFRPDKFINNQYVCGKCGFRFYSVKQRKSITNSEFIQNIRKIKLKKLKI